MRVWMVAAATTLVLAIGSQTAEARGGRGVGRLFSGHSHTTYRSVAQNQLSGARVEPRGGTLSYQPALSITPGRMASATAVSTALPASSAEMPSTGEFITQPARSEPLGPKPVQEAVALRSSCAPHKRVGGLGDEGTGFCLIN
jgi:hypothetical protein